METNFDADELACNLYAFRATVLFYLTDELPLPEYISNPLSEAMVMVNAALRELEARHKCTEAGVIQLGHGNDIER
ncbi:MAG: hypothetical protein R3E14_05100 [Erythrobacter sp.]